ncbi:hypothetical protein L6164_032080 [Bauhinia variegata]|uniref:Uncharacterized protein n=1 Tax=Bauhinia variegata TaxID=167791 RepID=A0ACB9KMM5_BAUVA|nr:hypothetical protein L6164_032080 [Bauhinia variegata]
MATMSLGLFSSFLTGETASFVVVPSSSSLRLVLARTSASLRSARTVTSATVSQDSQPSSGKQPRGIMRPRRISPEMQALVGVAEISRTQALKLIWAHIKENNLQDPENKKIIICDEKLKNIFKKDQVGFLEIAGLITPHFLK